MPGRIPSQWSWLLIGLTAAALFSLLVLLAIPGRPGQASNARSAAPAGIPAPHPGIPIRLLIPKLSLNVKLESVGLTSQGAVDVPKGRADAAWFDLGPRPGAAGNAIIDGHFGWWKNGTPAIFNNLYKLLPGDKIYVTDAAGATTVFIVRSSRGYQQIDDATSVFLSSDGQSHLNLVTCAGAWNTDSQSYPQRLVVFADKE